MFKRLFLIGLPFLIIGLGVLTARYMLDTGRSVEPTADPAMAAGEPGDVATVSTLTLSYESAQPEWRLYGRLLPERQVEKRAPLDAEVVSLLVDNGSLVSAGDSLLELDTGPAQRELARLQARERDLAAQLREENRAQAAAEEALAIEEELVAIAERSMQRVRSLQQRNLASASDLEEAERALQSQRQSLNQQRLQVDGHEDRLERLEIQREQLQLDIEDIEENIEDARVTAPFDAEVTGLHVSLNSTVSTGETLLSLVDRSRLRVEAPVPAEQAHRLRAGMTAELHRQQGALSLVLDGWESVSSGGSLRLRFFLNTSEFESGEFRPPLEGHYPVNLALEEETDVFILPVTALYENQFVYRIEDDRLQRVSVNVVGHQGHQREVRVLIRSEDLNPGDSVLVTRLANAVTGLPVLVRED